MRCDAKPRAGVIRCLLPGRRGLGIPRTHAASPQPDAGTLLDVVRGRSGAHSSGMGLGSGKAKRAGHEDGRRREVVPRLAVASPDGEVQLPRRLRPQLPRRTPMFK
jgi:hypothetical protein